MHHEPPNPLDYASPTPNRTPPSAASLVTGILLLVVGGLLFFIGIIAIGLDIRMGSPDARSIVFAAAGAFACWLGMMLKRDRPPG